MTKGGQENRRKYVKKENLKRNKKTLGREERNDEGGEKEKRTRK